MGRLRQDHDCARETFQRGSLCAIFLASSLCSCRGKLRVATGAFNKFNIFQCMQKTQCIDTAVCTVTLLRLKNTLCDSQVFCKTLHVSCLLPTLGLAPSELSFSFNPLSLPSHPPITHSSSKPKGMPMANRTLGTPGSMLFQADFSDILARNWAGEGSLCARAPGSCRFRIPRHLDNPSLWQPAPAEGE
jgi:hypothetical protein